MSREPTVEQEGLWAEHRHLAELVKEAEEALRVWRVEHAVALGAYPIGTEVVWMRQAPGNRGAFWAGGRWGTVRGYHFAEWGSLVAEIDTSTEHARGYIDNDSACMAMPGYHYGTRDEYRAMLERELAAAAPSLPEPRPNER